MAAADEKDEYLNYVGVNYEVLMQEAALHQLQTCISGPWNAYGGWDVGIECGIRGETEFYHIPGTDRMGTGFDVAGDGEGYWLYTQENNGTKHYRTRSSLKIWHPQETIEDEIYGGEIPPGWEVYGPHKRRLRPGPRANWRREHLLELGPEHRGGEHVFLPRIFVWRESFELQEPYLMVAGRSAFPMDSQTAFHYRLTFDHEDMPHNGWVVSTYPSVRNFLWAGFALMELENRRRVQEAAWWVHERPAVTFPMLHIVPDDTYTWWPTYSTTLPKGETVRSQDVVGYFRAFAERLSQQQRNIYPCVPTFSWDVRRSGFRTGFRMPYVDPHNPYVYPFPWPLETPLPSIGWEEQGGDDDGEDDDGGPGPSSRSKRKRSAGSSSKSPHQSTKRAPVASSSRSHKGKGRAR